MDALAGYATGGDGAVLKTLKCNFAGTAAPGVGNDNTEGYSVGSRWLDCTNHHEYVADSVATGAANWIQTG